MFGFGSLLFVAGAANFIIELAKIKNTEAVDVILDSGNNGEENPPEQEILDLTEKTTKKRKKEDVGLVEDPFEK